MLLSSEGKVSNVRAAVRGKAVSQQETISNVGCLWSLSLFAQSPVPLPNFGLGIPTWIIVCWLCADRSTGLLMGRPSLGNVSKFHHMDSVEEVHASLDHLHVRTNCRLVPWWTRTLSLWSFVCYGRSCGSTACRSWVQECGLCLMWWWINGSFFLTLFVIQILQCSFISSAWTPKRTWLQP